MNRLPPGLPTGERTFDGVPFRLGIPVCVTGIQDARQGTLFPPEVAGIAVDKKAAIVHLLHGVDGTEKDGVPLASLVLRYSDGAREVIRLAYGLHARSVSPVRNESGTLHDPNSLLAWQGTNRINSRQSSLLRLYHSAIPNPRPTEKIASIDLISLFSRATPFLLAITTEEEPVRTRIKEEHPDRITRKAREFEDDVYHGQLVVRARDTGGEPNPMAEAALTVSDLEGSYFFGRAKADSAGVIRFALPRQHAAGLTLLVRASNRIPFVYESPKGSVGRLPSEIVAPLSAGSEAGGFVRGPGGQPVPGAAVSIFHLRQVSTKEYSRLDYDTVTTDETGKWRTTALPAALDGFQFAVVHADYRPRHYTLDSPARTGPFVLKSNDLRGGTATAELQPAPRLVGTVRNPSGQAVRGAEIRLSSSRNSTGDLSDDDFITRSDAEGNYKIAVPTAGTWNLIVLSEAYAPFVQSTILQDGPEPPRFDIILKPGHRFVGRVFDQVQQPISGAKVRLESWNDTRLVKFEAETDEQGTFVWTNAPDGQFRFYLSATNHSSTTYSISGDTPEQRFTLRKFPSVRGTVVDAETRKPISDFAIYRGRAYNLNEPMRWERYNTFRGRNGEYNIRLVDYGSSTRTAILIEAPGYMPAASPAFTKPGIYTNNFQLKRAQGIAGRVVDPEGVPVPGALLALVEPSESAYLRPNGDLSRTSDGGVQAKSGSDGSFQFAPRLEPHTLIATHNRGFAELRITNPLAPITLTLRPWARVTGRVALPAPPNRGHSVRLGNTFYRYPDDSRENQPLSVYLSAEASPDGSFKFDRVPPGERRVSIEHTVRVGDSSRSANSHGVSLILQAGDSTNVMVGDGGRSVIGRMKVLGGEPDDVDWKRDFHSLTPLRTLNMNLPQLDFSKAQTEEQQQELWAKQRKAEAAFWRTPEGRAYERNQISYVLQFETNGTFRLDGVPPGRYMLQVSPTDPTREDYSYDQIGNFSSEVTIPAVTPDQAGKVVDLGSFEIAVRGTMRIGKKAPRFSLKTYEGKDVKLEDFRGRFLLMDFWATWSGNRAFDLRQLKLVQERYAKDPRLAMVGINLDQLQTVGEQELKRNPASWPQCWGGSWNDGPTRTIFGLRNLPDCVLVDVDGKVAGFNLRGANILRVVERALGEPREK